MRIPIFFAVCSGRLRALLTLAGLKHPVEVLYPRQLTSLGHQLRACIGEQRAASSRDRDSATLVLRPLGHVLHWRGTNETKYTHSGIKAVKHKQRVGRPETLPAPASDAQGGLTRVAGRPLNRERRMDDDCSRTAPSEICYRPRGLYMAPARSTETRLLENTRGPSGLSSSLGLQLIPPI